MPTMHFCRFAGPGGPEGFGGMDPRDFFSQFASQFGGMFNEGGMPGMGRRAQRGGDIDVRKAVFSRLSCGVFMHARGCRRVFLHCLHAYVSLICLSVRPCSRALRVRSKYRWISWRLCKAVKKPFRLSA
jgi:hypothetical protein